MPAGINSLRLILGYPSWFHPRKEFTMPDLSLYEEDKLLYKFTYQNPDSTWQIENIELNAPIAESTVLRFEFVGKADKFTYLAWRLLGF